MVKSMFGKIDEYDVAKEESTNNVERLTEANLVSTDEQKQAVFISVIGAKSCKLIQNLVVLEKPGNLSFNDLMKIPTDHYSPVPSEIIKL